MKRIVVFAMLAMIGFTTQAQNVFNKGSLAFNAGLGAPVNYGYIPTINFSGDYGVIPTGDIGLIGFGGLIEFQFANYDYGTIYSSINPLFIVGPRAYWHLQFFKSDIFDIYVGAGFGFEYRGQQDVEGIYITDESIYGEGFVGGRWMFHDKLGLFAEVGGGSRSFFKGGITFFVGN